MDPFQVIAFDPGGSTGYAHFVYEDQGNFAFYSGTITTKEHHNIIRNTIETQSHYWAKPLTVLTESFEFRQNPDSAKQRRGLELVSREYIGVMKLVCQDLCIPLIQQSPADRNFITHEKLDRLGLLYKPLHENRHRIDALQHLIYYLVVKKGVEEIKMGIKRK